RSFRLIRPAQQKRALQRRYQSRGQAAHTIPRLPQRPYMSLTPAAPVLRAETESVIPAMCNRIRGLKEWSDIPRSLTRSLINFEYNPNVAPTEQVPAFLAERSKPLATRMARFGINLASSGGKRRPPLLNARTDSLRRGSFKTMLANKRCVIPAEGFYEWREEDGKKKPYFFARKDGKPVMFAGIWDYSDVKGEAVPSFAILTDEPNELVAPYHDRACQWCSATWNGGLTLTPRSMMSTRSDPSVSPCARLIRRSTRSRKRTSTRSSAPPDPLRCAAFLASTGEGYQNLHSP